MDPSVSGLWATVLAGGSGRRLAALTGGVPKQFWGGSDRGTLLDTTLARIAPLVPSRRTVVVIDRAHESYVKRLSNSRSAPRILAQRCDRGTAAGVLLGIMPALESARDPVVLLTPSDHGVVDTSGFQTAIRAAVIRVGCGLQDAILFGAEPDTDDDDYGWITLDPARPASRSAALQPVINFVEKPSPAVAVRLRAAGAAWNTMVLVAKSSTLLGLYRRHLPELTAVFDHALSLPARTRGAFLDGQYPNLPAADFCRDVLTSANGIWVHRLPAALGWFDLGTPARLQHWLKGPGASRRSLSA